ncbi:MAG: S8 family serine peptidase [bacterium]
MKKLFTTPMISAVLAVMVALLVGITSGRAEKIKIEKLDDLPEHTYTLKIKAADLFENDAELMKLAKAVEKDLLADLDKYDIQDKTTLKDFYGRLGTVALLEERWDDYLKLLEKRRMLEDKEAARLTTGLFGQSVIKAKRSGGNFEKMLKAEYQKAVTPLPYDIVVDDLEGAKGQSEIITENLLIGIINEQIQPILDKSNGEISQDVATRLVSMNYMTRMYLPYKHIVTEVLSAYLDAHKVVKPDIWADRDVVLTVKDKGKPVVIGIWDSGVDMPIFAKEKVAFMNKKETLNGKDDDKNGYVDDLHGIAYDIESYKTPEPLYPIENIGTDRKELQFLMKGLTDLTSNIDSEESGKLKKMLGSLGPDEVKPFIEGISAYGNHSHGTHVAGIAARGNAFARILAARLSFDHRMIPPKPTVESARRDSVMMVEVVQYFKDNNVRVVNMSWGNSMEEIESALEANGVSNADERKALTREIFEIEKGGLLKAIKEAPEILFITSAGNSDNDVNFEEYIPSSFDLPNIMSIGAVDQAGDETNFTSFGKVDVYANGFEVMSYVPGGDQMALSGTSMSSPNVTNLAGKLFAMNPKLKPADVRMLIEEAADEKKAGDRVVKLINPQKSMELLKKM